MHNKGLILLDSGKSWTQPLQLLTASLDKTVVVWAPEDRGDGVWLEQDRMGEVGGNTLGFYGTKFGPRGNTILAHSYTGGFHIWNRTQVSGATCQMLILNILRLVSVWNIKEHPHCIQLI